MARPRKNGLDYFPHDTDAVNDEKIEAMRALYGNDGYAFYFIFLERIYRSNEAELDISKLTVKATLISKIGVTPERFNELLETAFEIELFDRQSYLSRSVLTSSGIKKRCEDVFKMRDKWRKKKGKTDDFPEENSEETPESKVKQIKVKETKLITSSRNKKTTYSEDNQYYQMSVYFHQQIMKTAALNNKAHLVANADLQKWSDEFRKIVELDTRDKQELKNVIDWCTADPFWQLNILSPSKLRKQYTQLAIKMGGVPSHSISQTARQKKNQEEMSLLKQFYEEGLANEADGDGEAFGVD